VLARLVAEYCCSGVDFTVFKPDHMWCTFGFIFNDMEFICVGRRFGKLSSNGELDMNFSNVRNIECNYGESAKRGFGPPFTNFELAYATLELQLALMFHVPKIYLTRYYTGVFVNLEDTEEVTNHDSFAYNGTHECQKYESCHMTRTHILRWW
jgi:hypothetical protein